MPGDPKECHEHAKHCYELAESTLSPLAKARFEELARERTQRVWRLGEPLGGSTLILLFGAILFASSLGPARPF